MSDQEIRSCKDMIQIYRVMTMFHGIHNDIIPDPNAPFITFLCGFNMMISISDIAKSDVDPTDILKAI